MLRQLFDLSAELRLTMNERHYTQLTMITRHDILRIQIRFRKELRELQGWVNYRMQLLDYAMLTYLHETINFNHMAKINPYLNFDGTAEEAFNFYKSVFGGEFIMVMRFRDMGGNVPEAELDRIAHIALPIGNGNILMASDTSSSFGQTFEEGNNFFVSVTAESKEEADKLFTGLSQGSTIQVPIGDAPWGAYFGQLKDQYGIQWMMSFEYPKK